MSAMTKDDWALIDARANLQWAAEGEFSTRITPAQARALLHEEKNLLSTIEMQKVIIEQLTPEPSKPSKVGWLASRPGPPPV